MPNPDSFSDSDPSDTDVAAVDLSLPGPEASPGTLRKVRARSVLLHSPVRSTILTNYSLAEA